MKRNHSNELKVIWALVIALLIGLVAHAQDFCVQFTPPVDKSDINSYVLYSSTNKVDWKWQGWCPANTNQINFTSRNLPANPCYLAAKSKTTLSESDFSESIKFDTADFVVTNAPTPLPNPVLPPTFLLIKKL